MRSFLSQMIDQILIFTSLLISGIIAVFGLYAVSGAGYIRKLPWLKQMLTIISAIYIMRGLLLVGLVYLSGTIGGWRTFVSSE